MFLNIVVICLTLLTLTSVWIIIRGPSSWDRLQGLAVLSSKVVLLIVLLAMIHDLSFLADLAVVFSLLGFINLFLIARYFRRRHL